MRIDRFALALKTKTRIGCRAILGRWASSSSLCAYVATPHRDSSSDEDAHWAKFGCSSVDREKYTCPESG
eukprot:770288-Pleurochrysis_carterae.AAC.1